MRIILRTVYFIFFILFKFIKVCIKYKVLNPFNVIIKYYRYLHILQDFHIIFWQIFTLCNIDGIKFLIIKLLLLWDLTVFYTNIHTHTLNINMYFAMNLSFSIMCHNIIINLPSVWIFHHKFALYLTNFNLIPSTK